MKKLLFILLVSIVSATAHAQLTNTKWKGTVQLDNPVDVLFDFGKDTFKVTGVADGSLIETMSYSVKDGILSIQKIEGTSNCEGTTIGKYKFDIKNDEITFTLVADDCGDRANVLDKTTWKKDK